MEERPVSVSALILDFDGVVVESTEIKTQAFQEMFRKHPQHLGAIKEYHQKHLGMSRYKKFRWIYKTLLKKPLSKRKLKALGARFSNIVLEKVMRAPFVPGALETLMHCKDAGIPVFIISGTPHRELCRIIKKRGLGPLVTRAWGSPMEKSAAIRKIRALYGLRSADMLFIGDGVFDYDAAKKEGVPFIARRSPGEPVDWARLGVPTIADLKPLTRLQNLRATAAPAGAAGATPSAVSMANG